MKTGVVTPTPVVTSSVSYVDRVWMFTKTNYLVDVAGDFWGGITAAIVALPLALAFALASGVDAKYGLYTAIVAAVVAALFGGSKVQITGPTGAMAVILAGIVAQYGIQKLWVAAILAGVFQIALGLSKMGRFVLYIPHPLITGFTNGIAVIIFAGQLNNALGLQFPAAGDANFFEKIYITVTHLPQANLSAVLLTAAILLIMWMMPVSITRRVPASLIGLTLITALAALLHLNVPTIGAIPHLLPSPQLPKWSWGDLSLLIRPALALAALGSIESLLSAVVADSMMTSERHDSNKELVGQGLANIVTAFFQGIPSTGAIARTAVNVKSGAKSRLSSIFHSVTLVIIMFFLADFAAHIPLAALAGILMMTSFRMVEWESTRAVFRAPEADRIVLLITFGITVAFDLILAVEIGLIAAGLLFIRRMSGLGMLNQSVDSILKTPEKAEPIQVCPYVVVFEVGGPIFFGAAEKFVNEVKKRFDMKVLILRLRLVTMIDATGVMAFRAILDHTEHIGAKLYISGLQPQVRSVLTKMELIDRIPEWRIFDRASEAIMAAAERMSKEVCTSCPHYIESGCDLLQSAQKPVSRPSETQTTPEVGLTMQNHP
ncbi:MAG: SulP family inorganic anion transporter [Nitrospirae bacterium]|nr:SulP family inorganic anion transporter [Candidatus Manganitrophaceae bacterium]